MSHNRNLQISTVLIIAGCICVFLFLQSQSSTPTTTTTTTTTPTATKPPFHERVAENQKRKQEQQQQLKKLKGEDEVATTAAPTPSPPDIVTTTKPKTIHVHVDSASQKLCPTNRFVERYFTTDPVSLRMAARAWRASGNSDSRNAQNTKIGNQQNEILLPPYIRNRKKSSVNSLPGHTGSHIPDAFGEILESYTSIEENANKHYGAAQAVDMFESFCGWDGVKARFSKHPDCMDKINFIQQQQQEKEKDNGEKKSSSRDQSSSPDHPAFLQSIVDDDAALAKHAPKLMDIVIPTIRDLDFLEKWRDFIEPFHLILVQDGDPKKFVKIPDWADFELHNRNDIESALGANSWIISKKDASIRNFGFLISKKRYVYTLDDDCFPVDPVESSAMMMNNNNNNIKQSSSSSNAAGWCSTLNPKDLLKGPNPILQHLRNLIKPSSPYFFNTIYDGFREGSDFVRGFPYSMRDGVPTVVSHGLWLNVPDYDAPTQLVKPLERNRRHVDAVLTIPAGVLFPLCSMNVAFDRKLIGPAFMQGLMGVGQPWARYDDMFAGWASKAVADHLGYGTKSGAPYIFHNKASNPFTNLKKEYKGLWWQEVVIAFFNRVQLPENCTSPETSYRALALQIRAELTPLHPYFDRLATAMIAWVDSWELAAQGKVEFRPSRLSIGEEAELVRQLERPPRVESSSSSSSSTSGEKQKIEKEESGCITYKQRYSECAAIRKLPVASQREYFRRVAGSGPSHSSANPAEDVKEVALLRMHHKDSDKHRWSNNNNKLDDLWMSVCTFVVEAAAATTATTAASSSSSTKAAKRDVFLLVLEGFESSIPLEFQPLVRTHSDSLAQRLYSKRIYAPPSVSSSPTPGGVPVSAGAKNRGDLAAFLFLKMNPQYNWAWVIKSDARYADKRGWGDFFTRSRAIARENEMMPPDVPYRHRKNGIVVNKNSSAAATLLDGISDFGLEEEDAHFIWWTPPIKQDGYFDNKNSKPKKSGVQPWQYAQRDFFSGSWREVLETSKWVGAFAPVYGISRTLAFSIDLDASLLRGHAHEEVAIPVAAQLRKLKIFPIYDGNGRGGGVNSQQFFEWPDRMRLGFESSPMYVAWASNTAIQAKTMANFSQGATFDGLNCVNNYLFYPVKL